MSKPRGYVDGPESPWTWANLVTMVRVLSCLVIFGYAFHTRSETWNFIGLGVYWVLDVADGFLARTLDEETRLGAQLDILGDRILVCLFYANYVFMHPGMLVPVFLFLFQFMGIDHHLSNQWLRWPIVSPNYFHFVDRKVFALNWSMGGKLLNSAVVTLVMVGTENVWAASAVAIAIIGLKVWSAVLVHRIPAPEPAWPEPKHQSLAS